jgi:hypothetical protein
MSKYAQGIFTPKHPEKYVGRGLPTYRSSWESVFFNFCDNHPSVLQWASESLRIPYKNPLTGKNTTYVPDLFFVYQDAAGKNHAELIEIKPNKETSMTEAKSRRDKLAVAINLAKWQAATAWAASNGIKFRVVTEHQLFAGGKK